MARDIGRKWGDLHEIFVWEDGVKLVGDRLYYFQAIHQESDVIPENVDCIRALMGVEEDWTKSVEKTDSAISTYYSMKCMASSEIVNSQRGPSLRKANDFFKSNLLCSFIDFAFTHFFYDFNGNY